MADPAPPKVKAVVFDASGAPVQFHVNHELTIAAVFFSLPEGWTGRLLADTTYRAAETLFVIPTLTEFDALA